MASLPIAEQDYPITDLLVVNYDNLQLKDATEAANMYLACIERGFFYLDLGDSRSNSMLQTVDELFKVTNEYFAKTLEEKSKDTRTETDVFNICGYKPLGLDLGNVENQKDGCEGLRLPLDLLRDPVTNLRIAIPNGVKKDWHTVTKFMEDSYAICSNMLDSLSRSMGLEGEKRLELQHQMSSSSTSSAALQCYPVAGLPPNTSQGHFVHTDSGSLSVLFVSDWGLQVHSPKHDRWESVAPRPGCAIVNVGDSLRFLSGLKLRSSLHRVVPHRERRTLGPRYSIAFFLRPNNNATFTDAEGTQWTGSDWLNKKFLNYRRPHQEQRQTILATGQKGFLGLRQEMDFT